MIANAMYNLSFCYIDTDQDRTRGFLRRSLEIYHALGDRHGIARASWALGDAEFVTNPQEAVHLLQASLDLAREVGDDFLTGWALYVLGATQEKLERHDLARERLQQALRLFAQAGDLPGILFGFEGLAANALSGGQAERAVRLVSAAATLRVSTGTLLADRETQARIDSAGKGLTEEEIARARSEGAAMTLEEAVAYALEQEDPDAP
jgi:tetratricopeptide (TPR) repeat protein